ncbi:hypothetical protein Mal48_11640 [Thalassoglobus polymorphus]|uniref:Uncharacterized protein n=1 Tax=Thalassoglobus polymorphus TaxID=2527994 RepID=A0A517QJV6_9PLAN|nr:hypothetical protein Mal48_11640 [Thalassoglobus polymorphus]
MATRFMKIRFVKIQSARTKRAGNFESVTTNPHREQKRAFSLSYYLVNGGVATAEAKVYSQTGDQLCFPESEANSIVDHQVLPRGELSAKS